MDLSVLSISQSPEIHTSRKSREFHAYTFDLRSSCVDFALGGQAGKNLRRVRTNLSSTKVNASLRKWVAKRNASWSCVEFRVLCMVVTSGNLASRDGVEYLHKRRMIGW